MVLKTKSGSFDMRSKGAVKAKAAQKSEEMSGMVAFVLAIPSAYPIVLLSLSIPNFEISNLKDIWFWLGIILVFYGIWGIKRANMHALFTLFLGLLPITFVGLLFLVGEVARYFFGNI